MRVCQEANSLPEGNHEQNSVNNNGKIALSGISIMVTFLILLLVGNTVL